MLRDGFPACSPRAMIDMLDNASSQQAAIGQVKVENISGGNTMTRLSAITTALALAGAATFSHGALAQTGTGWTQLFDGKSLDGWDQVGTANWRVEDGAIVAYGRWTAYLMI